MRPFRKRPVRLYVLLHGNEECPVRETRRRTAIGLRHRSCMKRMRVSTLGISDMDIVYFIQQGQGGSTRIKIGKTAGCPYDCLKRILRSLPKDRFELLGQIPVPYGKLGSTEKGKQQSQFESLRENGDWFRLGSELAYYIGHHARPHICNRSCPDGTPIYEEWFAEQIAASEAVQKVFSKRG